MEQTWSAEEERHRASERERERVCVCEGLSECETKQNVGPNASETRFSTRND